MKKLLLVTTALLFACVNANADTFLPAYQVTGYIDWQVTDPVTSAGTPNEVLINQAGPLNTTFGNNNVGLNGGGSVTIDGDAINPDVWVHIATQLTYWVEIVGADGIVPVNIAAYLYAGAFASGAGGASAGSALSIDYGQGNVLSKSIGTNSDGLVTWSVDNRYDFFFFVPYTVTLIAQGDAAGGGISHDIINGGQGGAAHFTAYADPVFIVPDGYTLLLSDGISNGLAPVPGPIVGAGLPGLLGLLSFGGWNCWRRRKLQVVRV